MRTVDHMPAASWQDAVLDATGARVWFWVAGALSLALAFGQAVFS